MFKKFFGGAFGALLGLATVSLGAVLTVTFLIAVCLYLLLG